MQLGKKQNDDDIELDMSPMIDMVFLLLIFFIVVSQVIDEKPKIEVPEASVAKVAEETINRLMITVMKDETYYIESNLNAVEIDEIKEKVEFELSRNPKLRVLIRSDGSVPYETNEKVMNACADVGALDLIFSVIKK